jgi:hypothetical protein
MRVKLMEEEKVFKSMMMKRQEYKRMGREHEDIGREYIEEGGARREEEAIVAVAVWMREMKRIRKDREIR